MNLKLYVASRLLPDKSLIAAIGIVTEYHVLGLLVFDILISILITCLINELYDKSSFIWILNKKRGRKIDFGKIYSYFLLFAANPPNMLITAMANGTIGVPVSCMLIMLAASTVFTGTGVIGFVGTGFRAIKS